MNNNNNNNKIKFLGFRWWDLITEKMSYVDFDDILHQENLPHHSSCDYEVMRVAFISENGKPVYEGDILSWHEYQGWEIGITIEGIYIVKWNDSSQEFTLYDPFMSECFNALDTNYDEVVGNIYENKNLLPSEENS